MNPLERIPNLLTDCVPVDVFDFYDEPRFYSCRDLVGQMYVIYWIDEQTAGSSWLCLRASAERYASLKSGSISVARALASPEERFAYVIHLRGDSQSVEQVRAADIDRDWLPAETYRLSQESGNLHTKSSSAVHAAIATSRDVLDVAFEKAANKYEIGCGRLGRLLESIQNTLYALASEGSHDVRKIPEHVKFHAELLVTDVFASSFGVRLQSKAPELFPSGGTVESIRTLAQLIGSIGEPNRLWQDLHQLNVLSRSRFKHLLRVISDTEVAVALEWGSPTGTSYLGRATLTQVVSALHKLDETDDGAVRIVDRPGRLVGVDVQSDFFALAVEGGEVIKGRLSEEMAQRQFKVPSNISAHLEERHQIDRLTDRERWTYRLLDATVTD